MNDYSYYQLIGRILTPVEGEFYPPMGKDELRHIDWPVLFRVAGDGLVTPSLAGALKRKGLDTC